MPLACRSQYPSGTAQLSTKPALGCPFVTKGRGGKTTPLSVGTNESRRSDRGPLKCSMATLLRLRGDHAVRARPPGPGGGEPGPAHAPEKCPNMKVRVGESISAG